MNANQVVESLLALSQQEELVDLPKDHPLSESEDEGDSDGERKHQKLLEAIHSLYDKNRQKLIERSEAGLKVSEFNVSSKGSGEKLVLADLLEPVETSSFLATVKKQLNRVKSKKVIEQIHREVAFSETSQILSRWDPFILKNRQAEQLAFPLGKEQPAIAPIEHVLSGWKARTPLEQEIFTLLHKNKQPAKMHRAELQRAWALQSYYEAKAQREKKIKNKKYHKEVIKKGKAKKALKDFEQLQKVNPTAALEELEKIENARMIERMSLKYQSSGKWAKSKAIMAKYDLEAHQAMQEQLAKNKELTEKLQVAFESEEEEGGTKDVEELFVPEVVNEVQKNVDGLNPWMLRSYTSNTKEVATQEDPEQLPEPAAHKVSGSEREERPVAEEENLLRGFEERRSLRKRSELNQDVEPADSQKTKDSSSQAVLSELRALTNSETEEKPSVQEAKSKFRGDCSPGPERGTCPRRGIIKEAFAGDDVIRDFLKEKKEAVEASKPKDVDLILPGWGEWGGVGLKPSAKKRRRFLIKAPEGPPRKDKNLPNVIISEKRNIHAAAHQVRVLPYPLTHHQQFERTIQTPVGSTWNTQRAFHKLTTLKVITKPGRIIKPIKAEDVGYQSSSRSDLSAIQRNPKQITRHKKQLK
uniref:UTP14C small subunit processome component n=1 Tax=Aotus nancymaae TaxID=37293 RepID=A0A2K5F856_AOTNA